MTSCDFCKVDSKKAQVKSCVCKKVFYCSKQCQAKDWKAHKPSCSPFTTRESPGKGRGLFATRRIKAGEVILEEYPLLTRDGWSLVRFGAMDFDIDEDTKAQILKLHDPEENLKTLKYKTVQELDLFPLCWCWMKWKETQSEEQNKIMRIFCGNSHGILCSLTLSRNRSERGLYYNMCRINHSCVPNATWSSVEGDYKQLQVRALKTIEKGQEILFNYQSGDIKFHYGLREARQQELLKTSGFLCKCSECSLEGEELSKNELLRMEIRMKDMEMDPLMSYEGNVQRRFMKTFLQLSKEKMNLVEKLGIRGETFMFEKLAFCASATLAKRMGVAAPDPNISKEEALKHAQICGGKRFLDEIERKYF